MRTIEEILKEIDKYHNNPYKRNAISDGLVDEIRDIFGDDRLTEICDAERDGRCVVLPCKVGDVLYQIDIDPLYNDKSIRMYDVENITICGDKDKDILLKYDSYDGVICTVENLINGTLYLDYLLTFLTREEAEKALEGGAE